MKLKRPKILKPSKQQPTNQLTSETNNLSFNCCCTVFKDLVNKMVTLNDDAYEKIKFEQLTIANNSNVLYYSRDKYSSVLGRKLKPEFSKFFISAELKDCIKMLGKITNEKMDSNNSVDIILAESDSSTLKLIDYVNKRPTGPETSNCPLIPIILLLTENSDPDFSDMARNAGGVSKIIKIPTKTKNILVGMIEVLHTRKQVEDTFKDLKRTKIMTSKYPYLPIFAGTEAAPKTDKPSDSNQSEHSSHNHNHRIAVDEIDDGTECSSLLPNFVTATRAQNPQNTRSSAGGRGTSKYLSTKYDQLDDSITKEIVDMELVADKLTSGSKSGSKSNKSVTMPGGDEDQSEGGAGDGDRDTKMDALLLKINEESGSPVKLKNIRHFGSNQAMADERYLVNDNDGEAQLNKQNTFATLLGGPKGRRPTHSAVTNHNKPHSQTAATNEKALLLLDPICRPTWNEHGSPSNRHDNDDMSADEDETGDPIMQQYAHNDIYPFIKKAAPKINVQYTVGGLDKRSANAHWRVLNNINNNKKIDAGATPKGKGVTPFGTTDEFDLPMVHSTDSGPPSPTIKNRTLPRPSTTGSATGGTGYGALLRKTYDTTYDISPSASMSFKAVAGTVGRLMSLSVNISKNASFASLPEVIEAATRPVTANGISHSRGHGNDHHVAVQSNQGKLMEIKPVSKSKTGAVKVDYQASRRKVMQSIQAIETSTKANYLAAKKAEKNILQLSRDKPFDIQVSALLSLDLYNRKINLGERDLLEKGLKLESDGDYKTASICYTRSGSHSKDQHISKMLLGNLHYAKGQLMVALKFFTLSIKLLESKPDHSRIKEDEFVAYHNRGIINFRLGDDESGLADLETATTLNPGHEGTRELLSLAKRRMGKFTAAINDAIANKALRQEKRRNDLMEEIQKQTDRRVSVFESGTKVDPRIALMDKMMSEDLPILQSDSVISRKNSTASLKSTASQTNLGSHTVASPGSPGTVNGTITSNKVTFQDPKDAVPTGLNQGTVLTAGTGTTGVTNVTSLTAGQAGALGGRSSMYSSATESNLALRTMQTRGYCLEIPDYDCKNSLKDKIREQKKLLRGGDAVDDSNNDGGFLKVFKLNHGYRMELFDDLFVKPSELQEALLLEPSKRMVHHIEVIATTLRLFPFLRSLSDSSVSDLANIIEYRALTSQEELFSQNMPSSAMCMLLKGNIQVKMLNSAATISEYIALGELPQYSSFGYIDFLFRHKNQFIVKELQEILYPKAPRHSHSGPMGGHNPNDSFYSAASYSTFEDPLSPGPGGVGVGMNAGANNNTNNTNNNNKGVVVGEESIAKKISNGEQLDRSLSSGMFMSYSMQSMCELLMVGEKDFERILLSSALDDLKKRLEVIKSCRIFEQWTKNDHIRLARMGQVRTYKRGEVILSQGAKPSFLYVIMKGMCKVHKRPNRTEMLVQKLQEARDKAERHDLKYTYHHKLRDVLTLHKNVVAATPATATTGDKSNTSSSGGVVATLGDMHSAAPSGAPSAAPSPKHNRTGSATPKHGAATPKHGAATPKHLPPSTPKNHSSHGTPSQSHAGTPKNSATAASSGNDLRKLMHKSPSNSAAQLRKLLAAHAENYENFEPPDIFDIAHLTETLPDHLTEQEFTRNEIQNEINRLEMLIARAAAQDARENTTGSGSGADKAPPISAIQSAIIKLNKEKFAVGSTNKSFSQTIPVRDTTDSIIKNKVAEIATLQWPMIFGEACVLDPENGGSRGTITADTICDVFVLHKTQIQTFQVDDYFLEKVKGKAVLYPGDPDIVVTLYRQQNWKQYRQEIMDTIPKDRWPTKIVEYEPFNV